MIVGGIFLTLATHGTDHYLVQRLLVARSQKDATRGLVLSGFLVFAQFVLFLLLGTLLWAFYGGRGFGRTDEVLPTFAATELPAGGDGLHPRRDRRRRALALAQLDGLDDAPRLLRPLLQAPCRRGASRCAPLGSSRWSGASLQMGVAFVAQNLDSALQAGLAALGYASGPTVGRSCSGSSLAPRPPGALRECGRPRPEPHRGRLAPTLFGRPGVAWTWNVATGAVATFVVGLAVSRLRPAPTVLGLDGTLSDEMSSLTTDQVLRDRSTNSARCLVARSPSGVLQAASIVARSSQKSSITASQPG